MRGGYQVVATALNLAYSWPDGRTVDRRQVEMWFIRETLNKDGEPPPHEVDTDDEAPRTQPFYIFETDHWVVWVAPGVPGERRRGWVIPVPVVRQP